MSLLNGKLPEGATLVTPEILDSATTRHVRCPMLSERVGIEVYVKVRAIPRIEYLLSLPADPPGSEQWPTADAVEVARLTEEYGPARATEYAAGIAAERDRLTRDWMATLAPEAREARLRALSDVWPRVLSLGAVEPRLTLEQARELGPDIEVIAAEILRLSGLIPWQQPVPEAAAA